MGTRHTSRRHDSHLVDSGRKKKQRGEKENNEIIFFQIYVFKFRDFITFT